MDLGVHIYNSDDEDDEIRTDADTDLVPARVEADAGHVEPAVVPGPGPIDVVAADPNESADEDLICDTVPDLPFWNNNDRDNYQDVRSITSMFDGSMVDNDTWKIMYTVLQQHDEEEEHQSASRVSVPTTDLMSVPAPEFVVCPKLVPDSSEVISLCNVNDPSPPRSSAPALQRNQSPSPSRSVIHSSDSLLPISPSVNGPNRSSPSEVTRPASQPEPIKEPPLCSYENEGKTMARINDLRKQGRWEDSRIPRCVTAEPFSRGLKNFTKEVCWVATLIGKERKVKMAMAKKLAYAAKKWHEKKEEQKERQIKEEHQRMRKIAKQIASGVLAWWTEVRKVAQVKQKEEIDLLKKRIRDLHLQHLMDQTEEYSSRMAKGLEHTASQVVPAILPENLEEIDPADQEYKQEDSESLPPDEEETISDEESQLSPADQRRNEDMLLKEAELPLEDLLPPGYSDYIRSQQQGSSKETSRKRPWTRSRNDSGEVFHGKKESKEDHLSQLVDMAVSERASSLDNTFLDEKIRSHEAALEKLRPKGNSLSSTEVVTKVPFLLRGQLREYQHVGLDWLVSLYKNKMNGILADEMGLGKTIQTIAFLAHLASEEQNWGPHLIIVPTSVLLNWELEFKRWCPGFIIKTYYGSRKQRAELRTGWTKPDSFHVCITSYKIATQDYVSFRRMRWTYLILDEAQAIKNYKSQRWTRIAEFSSHRRLLITGTPMQNNLEEVWALLHFLAPALFESLTMFQQLFSNPLTAVSEGRKPQDTAIVKQLHTVLRPFILRRMKTEVETQLPKKYEHVLKCRLSKRQRYLYDDYMSRSRTKETLKTGNYLSVINILMQLRKVCNHPNLFEERPVLSPLVVHPLIVQLPAAVFDVAYVEPGESISLSVKAPLWYQWEQSLFTLQRTSQLVPKKPLIEEITDSLESLPARNRRSLPTELGSVLESCDFSMIDLTSAVPFVEVHKKRMPSILVTIHTGKRKKAVAKPKSGRKKKGKSDEHLENGTKRRKLMIEEQRIASKQLMETIRPGRLLKQHEEHLNVLDKSNRAKCCAKPLLSRNVLELLTLKCNDADKYFSFFNGFASCRRAQVIPVRQGFGDVDATCGLHRLVEMGTCIDKYFDVLDTRFWIERASVAFPTVITLPPVLSLHNLSYHVDFPANERHDVLEPVVQKAMEKVHPVDRLRLLKFPETRLIQYDCGKLQTLDMLLRELFVEGHRALIFTQMTRVLDILEIFLTYHGYKYLRLDGTTGVEQRQVLMDRFNRDTRYFCFILSTRSGGVGVNLTGADTVIFYDSDWNPTMDAQAQDRCHRIGQTRDVHIYRLISEYTVEENIFMKANQKRFLGHLAIESGGFTTQVLKKENFKDIFGLEDEELSADIEEDVNEVAYETAITKAEDAEDVESAKKAKAEATVEDDENDDDDDDETLKYKSIVKMLNGIQCYGVLYSVANVLDQEVMSELEQTREEVVRRKKEWELTRLEAAKAERDKKTEEANSPFPVSREKFDPKVRATSQSDKRLTITNGPSSNGASKKSVSQTRPSQSAPIPQSSSEQKAVEPVVRSVRIRARKFSTSQEPEAVNFVSTNNKPVVIKNPAPQKKSRSASKPAVSVKKKKDDDPDFRLPSATVKPKAVNGTLAKNPPVNTEKLVVATRSVSLRTTSTSEVVAGPLPPAAIIIPPPVAPASAVVAPVAVPAGGISTNGVAGIERMTTRSRGRSGC